MLLMLGCFAATVYLELPKAPAPVIENHLTAILPLSPAKASAPAPTALPLLSTNVAPSIPTDWIACLWLLGVASMSLYTMLGWTRVQRLRRHVLQPVDFECLDTLRHRLGITRAVRVCSSALAQVPSVIGWLRPVILLPVTALTGLTESQLQAIMAHELAHIRRHDYIVNLFQTAIETLLFYHPAVWWVGRQIRQERENCCDDIAVALTGDPVEYASALAEMEQIRVPEPALAANGGDLLSRIRRLLGEPETFSRSLGRIGAAALALLIAAVPALLSQEAKPSFEAATIKPNTGGDFGNYFRMMGVTPSMTNQSLKNMILWAYRVHDFQIIGGPGWMSSDRWDLQAKTTQGAAYDKMQLMVQSLLQDRFKLALHREIKELPIYNLTVAKAGLKIQPNAEGSCIPPDPKNPGPAPGKTFMDYCGTSGFGRCSMMGTSSTMTELAEALANPVAADRTVVNQTGIEFHFRYEVKYAPELTAISQPGGPPPACGDAPSIFTALQEQLGLRLDSAKGPVEVLVIDHAEKPSEN